MNYQELKSLKAVDEYPSVSIIVSTHRTMPEKEQDVIRVKNAAEQARNLLAEKFSKSEVSKLLAHLDTILNNINYVNTLDTLVIYVNNTGGSVYYLPIQSHDRVIVGSNLDISDFERYLSSSLRYWVLALSEKPTRLFMGQGKTLVEVNDTQIGTTQKGPYPNLWEYDVTGPSTGFPYQRNYDVTSDRELLAVGTGDKDSKYLDNLKKDFFREVDTLLGYRTTSEEDIPLILLGTEENRSIFEEVTKHKHLIIASNNGDFSDAPLQAVQKEVEPIIEKLSQAKREQALNEFQEAIGSLKHAYGFSWVWRVAQEGRIKTLLIEEDYNARGKVDKNNLENVIIEEENSAITDTATNEDLTSKLINLVLSKKGTIVFVKKELLKDYNHVAAILRY